MHDLTDKDVPKEHRHITLNFLKNLITGQYSRLSAIMRVKFFNFIKEHDIPEDISFRYININIYNFSSISKALK